jgi:Kef-type K+ transport system membrane component KefB
VADFSTVLIITMLFSVDHRASAGARAVLVALVVMLAAALFVGMRFATKFTAAGRLIERNAGSTAQLRIRAGFALLLGANLNLPALVADRKALMLVPLLFAAMVIVKAAPAAFYALQNSTRDAAAGVLQTAQLMLLVAAVQIGRQLGILSDAVCAAVILASFFTMLLAPIGSPSLGQGERGAPKQARSNR